MIKIISAVAVLASSLLASGATESHASRQLALIVPRPPQANPLALIVPRPPQVNPLALIVPRPPQANPLALIS